MAIRPSLQYTKPKNLPTSCSLQQSNFAIAFRKRHLHILQIFVSKSFHLFLIKASPPPPLSSPAARTQNKERKNNKPLYIPPSVALILLRGWSRQMAHAQNPRNADRCHAYSHLLQIASSRTSIHFSKQKLQSKRKLAWQFTEKLEF